MSELKKFRAYWWEILKSAKEGHELAVWIVLAVIWMAVSFENISGLHIPFFDPSIKETAKKWAEWIFGIGFFFWGLFWIPFKHHEALKAGHQAEMIETMRPFAAELTRYKEILRPKLILSCNSGISSCAVIAQSTHLYYFRIIVKNDCGQQGITGCFGKLMKVEKDGKTIRDQETNKLPFAPAADADSTAKTIHAGDSYPLDAIALFFEKTPNMVLFPEKDGKLIEPMEKSDKFLFGTFGEYILTIKVFGDGVPPATGRFKFKWTGDYATSDFTLIE
jgi:hypothetical protein